MNTDNDIEKIYRLALENGTSLESIYGMFLGMLQMYKQENMPAGDIKKIEIILSQIEEKLGK
jgi:hypothetical protein